MPEPFDYEWPRKRRGLKVSEAALLVALICGAFWFCLFACLWWTGDFPSDGRDL